MTLDEIRKITSRIRKHIFNTLTQHGLEWEDASVIALDVESAAVLRLIAIEYHNKL